MYWTMTDSLLKYKTAFAKKKVNPPNASFPLPPELIVLVARQDNYASLLKLLLVSKKTHSVLNNAFLWGDFALSRAGSNAALAWAIDRRCQSESILIRLLERGTNVDFGFRMAALRGHTKAAKIFLEHGIKTPPDAVEVAASQGHYTTVKVMLEHGATAKEGALRAAAREGYADLACLLMDHGASAEQSKVLQAASACGHSQVVKALLDRGVDVTESYGLEAAVSQGHAAVVEEYMKRRRWGDSGEPRTLRAQPGVLALAVRGEHSLVIVRLLDAWTDELEGKGEMAGCFHYAVSQHKTHIVQLFLERGVVVPSGCLDFAVQEQNVDMVKLLLDYVTKPNTSTRRCRVHLEDAATSTQPQEHQANVVGEPQLNCNNLIGHFHFAAFVGNPDVVSVFLRPFASSEIRRQLNSAKDIAFLVAAERGHLGVVKLLNDADITVAARLLARRKATAQGHWRIAVTLDLYEQSLRYSANPTVDSRSSCEPIVNRASTTNDDECNMVVGLS